MSDRQKNLGAIVSIGVCALLVGVGLIRLLSYSLGPVGDFVRQSFAGMICYDPDSLLNAQFFKLLATPTIVAGIYFFFRWRNAGRPAAPGSERIDRLNRIDFESPLLRLILTTVITAHWLGMEWWKFHTEGFYPWSALESRWLNLGVLAASQLLAFWGMKYLSFEPVTRSIAPPDKTPPED